VAGGPAQERVSPEGERWGHFVSLGGDHMSNRHVLTQKTWGEKGTEEQEEEKKPVSGGILNYRALQKKKKNRKKGGDAPG